MDAGKLKEQFKKMSDVDLCVIQWSRCVVFDESGAPVAEHNMSEITSDQLK